MYGDKRWPQQVAYAHSSGQSRTNPINEVRFMERKEVKGGFHPQKDPEPKKTFNVQRSTLNRKSQMGTRQWGRFMERGEVKGGFHPQKDPEPDWAEELRAKESKAGDGDALVLRNGPVSARAEPASRVTEVCRSESRLMARGVRRTPPRPPHHDLK